METDTEYSDNYIVTTSSTPIIEGDDDQSSEIWEIVSPTPTSQDVLNTSTNENKKRESSRSKTYICNVCNEQFDRSYKLKRHAFVGDHKGSAEEIKLKSENDGVEQPATAVAQPQPGTVTNIVQHQSVTPATTVNKTLNGRKISYTIKAEQKPAAASTTPIPIRNGQINGVNKLKRRNPTTQSSPTKPTQLSSLKSQTNPKSFNSTSSVKTETVNEKVYIIKIPSVQDSIVNKAAKQTLQLKSEIDSEVNADNSPVPKGIMKQEYQKFNKNTEHEWNQIIYQGGKGETNDVWYKCAVCNATFIELQTIDQHLQVHNGFPFSYTCELCDEQFSLAAHLKNHVIGHTQCTYRFECEHCQKRFGTEFDRQTHVINDKCLYQELTQMFKCNECRQTYLNENLYQSHLYVHSGKKPYKCDICNTEFIHLSALTKHRECDNTCEYTSTTTT